MGLWKNLKLFMGFEDEEEFSMESFDESIPVTKEKNILQAHTAHQDSARVQKATLLDMQTLRKKGGSSPAELRSASTEMVVCSPKTHQDSTLLSSYIKEGKAIIVNLNYLDAVEGKRLIDFICGTVYAFEGHMQKLGGKIFLFTPSNFNVLNRQHDDMEFNGQRRENNYMNDSAKMPQADMLEEVFFKSA